MPPVPLIIEPDRDDPDCAEILLDGTIGGRPYRFVLDTGAALTQIVADDVSSAVESTSAAPAALPLQMDDDGHFFVEVLWPGVAGLGCWDTRWAITRRPASG